MQDPTEASRKSILISGAETSLGAHFVFWQSTRAQRNLILASENIEAARAKLLERLLACAASYRISVSAEELAQRFQLVSSSLETNAVDELWHFSPDPESCSPLPAGETDLEELLSFGKKHSGNGFI